MLIGTPLKTSWSDEPLQPRARGGRILDDGLDQRAAGRSEAVAARDRRA